MSKDGGFAHADLSYAVFEIVMHVRTAHTTGTDTDKDFVTNRGGGCFGVDPKIVSAIKRINNIESDYHY
tara:strand:- start:376 stop:582 length:207 start_codon:yes stop_codon:yes gene_type:complete